MCLLFNQTCLNERLLPNYTHIYNFLWMSRVLVPNHVIISCKCHVQSYHITYYTSYCIDARLATFITLSSEYCAEHLKLK